MKYERFRPLLGKLYWLPLLFAFLVLLPMTVFPALKDPILLAFTLPTDLFCLYFFVSPLFGYVELRQDVLLIRYGLILKRVLRYESIRGTILGKGLCAESLLSLKYAWEHLHIQYATFGITTVSVVRNDRLAEAIRERISEKKGERSDERISK